MSRVLVKICGLTSVAMVEDALAAGADAIGLVLAKSPRQVTPDEARTLLAAVPPGVERIAVFRTPGPGDVAAIADLPFDGVQADLGWDGAGRLPAGWFFLPVLADGEDLEERADEVAALLARVGPSDPGSLRGAFLLDGPRGGGQGIPVDPDRAARAARCGRAVLAGGLRPDTVAEAIRRVRPAAVDVSSGVEASPGVKDPTAVARFVAEVRAADESTDEPGGTRTMIETTTHAVAGRYGPFGGSYVPEILIGPLARLQRAVDEHLAAPDFQAELTAELAQWAGRPTALTHAARLGEAWGAEVWLKREDLAHTGAHKINNALGQALLARRMGAGRVIAETGAGQHGVASAAACARLGLACRVYMGAVDVERQAPNVHRMRLFGAEVIGVETGDATLRAAIDEAMRDWAGDPEGAYYLLGSAVGPHPYPVLVRELQRVIGREARAQLLEQAGGPPTAVIACVGGGSNAIGLFYDFVGDEGVALVGVEAGGRGEELEQHAATLVRGRPGVLHGTHSYLLQDEHGQVQETHSISAGLDYPGVGPEHSWLKETGRATYTAATDDAALAALEECCRLEGILPALESAHALAGAREYALAHPGARLLVGCSGRGDKDIGILTGLAEGMDA